MTHAKEANGCSLASRPVTLGFLFSPLGWVRDWAAAAVATEPSLLADICGITRTRMHLIALALSHLESAQHCDMALCLTRGRARDILDRTLGRRPKGLKRAINNLSADVLSPEGYRRLVSLLDDPIASKCLGHAAFFDDDDLQTLASIPVALRPAIIPSGQAFPRGRIADGLHFLVMRGAAPDFETLVEELRTCRQPGQLSARIKAMIDTFTLPEALPPARIGLALRLDNRAELCALARKWRNCIERIYLESVDEGRCAIYLWADPQHPAVCAVERHGRMGWFLTEVRGPRNSAVDPDTLCRIELTFADAGYFHDAVARALQGLIDMEERERCRRGQRR